MSIQIIKSSTWATMQDGGRRGYQSQGIPISGAMDIDALVRANILVGNERHAACIEIASGKLEIAIKKDCVLALSGNGTEATCEGEAIPFNRQVWFRQGAKLSFAPTSNGFWTYLAVSGGFTLEKVLGSLSTYTAAQFGGVEGRAIKAGDELIFSRVNVIHLSDNQTFKYEKWGIAFCANESPIRVFQGPDWNRLTEASQQLFLDSDFKISADSNRMGYRLTGHTLQSKDKEELISTAVTSGTIQLVNDGSLIVLMADAQTIGGYPRVAQVASVDIPRIAQKRPGELIRFDFVSYNEACQLFLIRDQEWRRAETSIRLKWKEYAS